eukprot:NODE_1074_length_1590_cov_464.645685_g884_i0.p1 GENE.NODE_1074_length_1590_cov_464.645685_g884_i0~~NODE_1074_length_1590_cov_464.645685_g884_i0.p1  ORF type:complete len:415 (+),score=127.25 NODE_1074_length_1590_cov_464.645685_g884_i0:164-1408(+)
MSLVSKTSLGTDLVPKGVLSEKNVNAEDRRQSGEKRKNDAVQEESRKKKKIYIPHQSKEEGHFHVVLGEDLTPRYKLLDLMGEGTFAKVCELWDRQTKSYLACKIVRSVKKYTRDAEFELDILQKLKSCDREDKYPFVKLNGSFLHRVTRPGSPIPVAEHMCILFPRMGSSLLDWIIFHGAFSMQGVAKVAYQLCKSLDFLHNTMRLIHTDLKPENILFEEWDEDERTNRRFDKQQPRAPKSWKIRVIDFGGTTDERHSAHSIVSTRHYRAPEVILGTGWMFAADMWSVGCILVELCTGRVMFDTHDNREHLALMEAAISRIPAPITHGCTGEATKYLRPDRSLDWPRIAPSESSLQKVKRMKQLRDLLPKDDPEFLDLITKLLDYNKQTRIRAREVLTHPFVTRYVNPRDPRI